ncbi:hypothetical protein [Vallitalea maricola]
MKHEKMDKDNSQNVFYWLYMSTENVILEETEINIKKIKIIQ